MHTIKKRLATFLDALPTLLPDHLGKYALICDGEITVHDSAEAAMEAVPDGCDDVRHFLIIRIEPSPQDVRVVEPQSPRALITL